ncbi:MAG TPA: hypothetical protein VEZ90_17460, partial [Blastocatellia bacterium]|nr:hypothetical protein [Blastocatellia bacterium]
IWAVFFILVATGVHGASTPVLARYGTREPYDGYVFSRLKDYAKEKLHLGSDVDSLLMTVPPERRDDDYLVRFPEALAQLSHRPRFPVVNMNYWTGRNMLALPLVDAPVWHITALARPSTWGYFFLGAQRGLVWQWWFQIFACFSAMYLLLEIILQGRRTLAGFGAFWICESSYVVFFGYLPAQPLFYGALATVSAYYLLRSGRLRTKLCCSALLGLASVGFVMVLYPPWQVPTGYLFLMVFVGLAIREKLYTSLRSIDRGTAVSLALALVVAGVLLAAYFASCWSDLKILAQTIYPGHRRLNGGGYPLWWIFSGTYNLLTAYKSYGWTGTNGVASYYLLFPALAAPLALSSRWRRSIGPIGWLLVGYLLVLLAFCKLGLPEPVVKYTLLDRVQPQRSTIVIGAASIMVCVLALSEALKWGEIRSRMEKLIPAISAISVALLYVFTGLVMESKTHAVPPAQGILFASLVAGYLSYCLVAGRARSFCIITGIVVIATVALFNPLSTNLDYIYKSELAEQTERLEKGSDRPLWICYSVGKSDRLPPFGEYGGTLLSTLGQRTISGIQNFPALDFWRALDPTGKDAQYYNNTAVVFLTYTGEDGISFSSPADQMLVVKIAPDNPTLKAMGAKYILAIDEAASEVDPNRFPLIYRSRGGFFSIFAIP